MKVNIGMFQCNSQRYLHEGFQKRIYFLMGSKSSSYCKRVIEVRYRCVDKITI